MNERILELAGQCEGRTICECGEAGFNFEKFAELLIRECAEIADNADATREKWQSIGKFVKAHFGVEE